MLLKFYQIYDDKLRRIPVSKYEKYFFQMGRA